MATLFLTSSPTGPLDGSRKVEGFDPMNGFLINLSKHWNPYAKCLMITAFPKEHEKSEEMTRFFYEAAKKSYLSIFCMDLLDDRGVLNVTENDVIPIADRMSKRMLSTYEVIFLGGGHVPTQKEFFESIGLREMLDGFKGVIVGISAGTMNAAETVYAQPEEPGEATDPSYVRFFKGLGLTKKMILPHYQMVKDAKKDGLRLFEDITFPDSYGREFIALPDGSYIMEVDGIGKIYGEAYRIKDGGITEIN